MITWKYPVKGYEWLIYRVWYLRLDPDETVPTPPVLIPNPRAHLILTPPDQPYLYQNQDRHFSGQGAHLLTAIDGILHLQDQAPLQRLGITFQPSALYRLKAQGALPCVGVNQCYQGAHFISLADCFPEASTRTGAFWLNSQPAPDILARIKAHLDHLALDSQADHFTRYAEKAMVRLDDPGNLALDTQLLADACHCSRRTLERAFKRVTGLTLKQYQMMMRLEHLVLSIYQQDKVDWSRVAHACGFSDQPHLIRYLRQLLGKTPSRYMAARDLTIDIYGDFEQDFI